MHQYLDQQAIEEATRLQQAGRLADAEAIYRDILMRRPDCADAWHFLGLIAFEAGNPSMAVELIERAIAIDPGSANYQRNLSEVLRRTGDLDRAIVASCRAIDLQPDSALGHHQLGRLLLAKGDRANEAVAVLRRGVQLDRSVAAIHDDFGLALSAAGKSEESVIAHREAVRSSPESGGFHYNLGVALANCGRMDEAIDAYREALQRDPTMTAARLNLGIAFEETGRLGEAVACYTEVVRRRPDSWKAWGNLGGVLQSAGRLDEAVAACGEALRLNPDHGAAHNTLGNCWKELGRPEQAMESYREAIRYNPAASDWQSNLVFAAHFRSDYNSDDLLQEARKWAAQHAEPLRRHRKAHYNDPTPGRRLRIGYVSPDFKAHVVGANILPLLREHDPELFEAYCYADVPHPDAVTEASRSLCAQWRDISGSSHEAAAELIRNDRIDILVDLAQHTAGNRLPLFALEPAPVQVCYLGYCGTTGLDAMHYRLSDHYIDPDDAALAGYSEQTVRLPHSYWSYQPLGPTPKTSFSPAASAGRLTFGCLNSFAKTSAAALRTWFEILRAAPNSRLLLNAPAGSCREEIQQRCTRFGLSADRLEFVAWQPWEEYVRCFERINIALDPFPYGGGITTLDALWMGVPVVTLSGQTAVGRGGRSILSNLSLPELIADSPERYVEIASELAANLPRLSELRATLRDRMEASPLRDAKGHARAIEKAFREMWLRWSASFSPANPDA